MVSDYLCFWQVICGILRQVSRRVRFRLVLQSFFSESSYSYVFRSVYVLVLLFPYIVSVFKYLDLHSLKRTPF